MSWLDMQAAQKVGRFSVADRLRLVVVNSDGSEGIHLGTLTRRDDGSIHATGSSAAEDVLNQVKRMGQCNEREAYAKLVDSGWSNGKLMFVHELMDG